LKNYLQLDLSARGAQARASAEKFPRGMWATEKTRPENSIIKPPSTLSVSCMKIQESNGHRWSSCEQHSIFFMLNLFVVSINISLLSGVRTVFGQAELENIK